MPRTILVAHDFTEIADQALAWAAELARERGDALVLLHVLVLAPTAIAPDAVVPLTPPTPEERAEVAARLRDAAKRHGVDAAVEVTVAPNVGAAIVARTDEIGADLIVVGTHGRGAVSRAILGSVADHVVRHANVPVVTVRAHKPRRA
jgi:nucleotide-binding universal stress UspA family protein